MNIAFIDTETTGLDFIKHQVIQYASAIYDRNQNLVSKVDFCMEATREIDPEAAAITGYYVGKWIDKKMNPISYHEAAERIIQNLKSAEAVMAHNSPFDASFIKALLIEEGWRDRDLPKYWIDSASFAWLFRESGQIKSHSLSNTAKHFGIKLKQGKEHTAMNDVEILAETYFKMRKFISLTDPRI